MDQRKRLWLIGGFVILLVASFVLNDSFSKTLDRRRAIRQAEAETASIERRIEALRDDITRLKKDPRSYELLVRRDLGYLRPGETEVRIRRN